MVTKRAIDMGNIKVSEGAVIRRVNRKLAAEGEVMRKCRDNSRGHGELGDYYIVNIQSMYIQAMHQSLEETAREMGCLQPYEEIVYRWQEA